MKQALLNLTSRVYHLGRLKPEFKRRLSLRQLQQSGMTRTEQYVYCLYYYHHFLPAPFRHHREYFRSYQRAFGEDAFHAFWFLLFEEFKPKHALEIGVYRGQVVTLWQLLSGHLGSTCHIGCVSPFSAAGDAVSQYTPQLDYLADTEANHRHFGLEMPRCCRALSTTPEAHRFIGGQAWDMIYIDGSHNYEIAAADWAVCSGALAPGGVAVLDDSAVGTDYRPLRFATSGHPGPSQVAREIDRHRFKEIFSAGHNRAFQRIS